MTLLTLTEYAARVKRSRVRVCHMLAAKRIKGAKRFGNAWMIPATARWPGGKVGVRLGKKGRRNSTRSET